MTTKRNVLGFAIGAALIIVFFMTSAFPQGAETGGITGAVKDPHGASVPGAKVEIYNERTGTLERGLTTQSDGTYTAALLPPGSYRVEITAASFKRYRAVGLQVRITETTRHDAILELGEFTQSVEVEATPTLISTENATTGQPIDSHTLTSLPLASPNYLFLLTLSPGASSEPTDVRSAGRGNVDIIVNGQRTSNNSVALEGINVNDFNLAHFDNVPVPAPSAIEEFKVATSLYDASQGSKGGGAVALVLKSGTKQLHGEFYWEHRNDVLNANEWFRNSTGSPRGRLLQNVFGASGSGPAWGVGGFWFANYQGVRARNGIDPNGSTLTPTIQSFPTNPDGTTSAALLAPRYGLTPSQIDPIALNILNLKSKIYGGTFLVPRLGQGGCGAVDPKSVGTSSPDGAFKCTFSAIAPISDNQFTVSYDRPFRQDKDKISGRFFYDNGAVQKPFGTASSLAFPESVALHNRFISLTHTHLLSSRQANEFRVGFIRFFQPNVPTDLVNLSDIGATRPNISTLPGIYQISISNLFSIGTGVNDDRATVSNSFYYADTWSMTVGKHTLRAGGEATRYQLNRSNRFSIRGSLGFDSLGSASALTSPFANFLQGKITSLQSGAGDPQRYFRDTDWALFLQDDFRVKPRLTLNLGVRWELLGFAHDLFFRSSIYDATLLQKQPPVNPFLFAQSLNLGGFTGTPGVSNCTLNSCLGKKNVAPRVGFAWDLSGNQKWVVRGGFGMYFQRLSNQNLLQGSLTAPFFVQLIDSRGATAPTGQLQNPLPTQPPATAVATAFIPQVSFFAGLSRVAPSTNCPAVSGPLSPNDPCNFAVYVNQAGQFCQNYSPTGTSAANQATNCAINLASFATATPNTHAPYTEQWNLSIQRDLGKSWGLEMAYVGTHYVGGLGIFTPYQAVLASPSSPVKVTDNAGRTYTITANTAGNEAIRSPVLGIDRLRGARFLANIGQSIYHSGQATLSHRFQGGLFVQAAYTYSKVIDNVSGSLSTDELNSTRNGQNGANIFNDQNNPAQNRARGDFDRTHRFIASYSWDIPVAKSGIWGSQLFQGWTISGISTFQSGLPFSITDGNSGSAFGNVRQGTGILVCRPTSEQIFSLPTCTPGTPTTIQQIMITNGPIQNNLAHFLNPNFVSTANTCPTPAFCLFLPNSFVAGQGGIPVPGLAGYGNVPRNAFRGPFQQNWDFSVAKSFHVTERYRMQFRSDFFNIFNHPVFGFPSAVNVAATSTFGNITTTVLPARLIQFGLRLDF